MWQYLPMNVARLLLQIAVILAACRVLHSVLRRMGQPPVIGEIVAGLLLGPSLLGWLAPSWYASLFAPDSLPLLNSLSQVGLVLFMFVVGLRLDLQEVRESRHVAGLAGLLSIIVPFVAGLGLARPLHALVPEAPALLFSLFLAVSMSITAFPVLARILTDQGLTGTRLGQVAITCAALNDLVAWTLLAWISALAQSGGEAASVISTVGLLVGYGVLMIYGVRPAFAWLTHRFQAAGELPVILVMAFLSSWATEKIGIHALFGAFFAGAILPRGKDDASRRRVDEAAAKLEPITMVVLIPLFFAYTGLRTNLSLIGGSEAWVYTLAIIAVAVVGKVGGALLGGTILRFGVRDSLALGVLLNTRGLVELIVLNVGLDLGILSPSLFSMMVLMAVTTTLMAVPGLKIVLRMPSHTGRPVFGVAGQIFGRRESAGQSSSGF
ncbi:hypothetical protein F183_A28420 [Bryobacterales bacterium F-183]|nr:hypothetical protein F183_A28420 [Bryobacterales bacterium F-183]